MSIDKVILSMTQLNEVHLQLIDLGKEKQRAIIDNDSSSLTKLMTIENRLMKQMNEIERQREAHVNSFLQEKGIHSQLNLSVTELSRLVFDQNDKRVLLETREELLNNALKLKQQNELTTQLLEHALQFIDFSLNIIVGVDEDMIYQKPATSSPGPSNKINFFDAKA